MSGDMALKRELQELTQKAVTSRRQDARLSALVGILPVVQNLIQSMTDEKVELSFKLDGEELIARPTPALRGGEELIVNHEGTYQEVPEEADNHQVPRAVLSAMHTLQSLVASHDLHMVAAVCGYNPKRQKWTGSVVGHHAPESLPYLVAALRDSLTTTPPHPSR